MTVRRTTLLIAATLLVAACGSAGAATPTPTSGSAPTPGPTPTEVPGAGGGSGGTSGSGSGSSGGGVIGVVPPVVAPVGPGGAPGDPGTDPILGQATFVKPQPGQVDPHPVNVQLVRAHADGQRVTVELRWWSGVAPCAVLDSVDVARQGTTIGITANEGSAGQGMACIDIAQLKATVIDLGALDPGTYTISAAGDAKPVSITIP